MSETQVIEQTYVTTTVESKDEQTTSKHASTSGIISHNEGSTSDEEHDHRYDEGGNSEVVSISSSKLRASTPQLSNNVNTMSSSTREELLENFGECTECKRPNTGIDNWCLSCNSEHFRSQFNNWTSLNDNIDKIIKNSQLSAKNSNYVLEWIPYEKFKDVKYLAKGGYGTVYSAYWSDGHILGWDKKLNQWKRYGKDLVALKRLHNSQFITIEFLDQIVKTHLQLHDSNLIIQYYGLTQYPETDDYMIVMEYANQGSIRSYLNGRFNTMDWYGKMNILSNIVQGLEYIHSSGYVHYNFHVGNVLRTGTGETIITDIGIKKPIIKLTSVLRDKEEIYGVLPYLAPEVLYSKRFTTASDIYSFGIMMNEIISGLPPFNNVAHDNQLASDICMGRRPEIPEHIPRLLEDLIKRCWETKPSNRPSAKELKDLITQWWNDIQNDKETEIFTQCKDSEKSRNSTFTPTPLLYVSHPEAVYHSRLLEFDNLPKPNKTNRRSKLSSSSPYSASRQIDSTVEYQDDDQSEDAVSCSKRIIRRKSLGRVAFIGSLYNATRDTFCGTTLLKTKFPNDSISRADIPNNELLYDYEDSYKEKFDKLDVEAELKLSVLTGLFSLEGTSKYLNDVKESLRYVKGTLIYKLITVEENLNFYHDDVKECISIDGFSNFDATHVVIGIKWGATMITSFECKNTKEENKSQLEETLKYYFENLSLFTSRDDIIDGRSNFMSHFSIKLLGDVVPHNKKFPQSLNEVEKIIVEFPSYVKQFNDGKGFPIEYILYPLSEFAKLLSPNLIVNNMINESDEEVILKLVQIYDGLSESKQRLNDLFHDAKSISHLISDTNFNEINNRVQKVRIEEARFRREFAEHLIKIRSGKSNINEFESKIVAFQKSILSKSSFITFIDKHRSISIMVGLIPILKAKKVEYLGKNLTVDHILHKYTNKNIYILLDNDEYTINDNLSPVQSMFRNLYNSDEGSSRFFIANLKICTRIKCSRYPVIQHYINGKLNSSDYYNDNKGLFVSNLVKFDPAPRIIPINNPNKKMRLTIHCPQTDCPSATCNWKCFKCKRDIEYGFNRYLYCGCGESSIDHCKFRCNSPHHIEGFIPFESNTLIDLLPSAPPEEINILLLGETGVGKSTFINAFMNYLKFDTLNEAMSGNIEVLIPSQFTLRDENYDMKTIKIGDDDSNELLGNVGMSSTMECKSYVFHAPRNRHIRLIDTPGVGDTRGIDQDKKNFENILNCISNYKFLNGICILLKPNNSRVNIVFRFCIQELLSHLHKNAKDNIMFCFTNARGTFYRPGDTLPSLKEQLKKLNESSKVEIKINKHIIYCFDNESFRFLAAIKNNIQFTQNEEQNFAESWKRSVDEAKRLIEYIAECPPHQVEDTLSLNNARNIVVILSKLLAEIGQLIRTNIKLIKEQQKEIANSKQTIEELKDKLYIPQIDLEPVSLGYPRLVCTSSSCVKVVEIDQTNQKKIDYITCQDKICLNNVECDTINDAALRNCEVMFRGTCKKCGCKWDKHMRITYENKQIIKKIIDQNVESQISKKQSDQETKRAIIEGYQFKVEQLQNEQKIINEISIKFAQFLRQNAIAAFNDAYADYLDHFIIEEKIKKSVDPNHYDDEILKGLENMKKSYLEQIVVIKQAIESNDPSMPPISPSDMNKLEQQLYNLPINGHTLKKIRDEAKLSQTNVL
ncbi:hypothetical protein C1645_878195 [Glomus cerebriforme]|uniref:Protein kinase domain-containing protein n=1 Tax=Glomus cerebriforme TaxID=658196 RepID=A0A397SWP9_9GLOM|nr:hypothetical protein C1645_878195 [Glomus cerebriforme]